MRVSTAGVPREILAMFRMLDVEVGESIDLPRLKRHWQQTGFREDDLINGLATLCAEGTLSYVDSDCGLIVRSKSFPPQSMDLEFWSVISSLHRMLRNLVLPGRPNPTAGDHGPAHERRKSSSFVL